MDELADFLIARLASYRHYKRVLRAHYHGRSNVVVADVPLGGSWRFLPASPHSELWSVYMYHRFGCCQYEGNLTLNRLINSGQFGHPHYAWLSAANRTVVKLPAVASSLYDLYIFEKKLP